MAQTNGIDIQGFLKQVNKGGKADINGAAKLLTKQENLSSIFSNAQKSDLPDISKMAAAHQSELINIIKTSLGTVVMSDNNAELSETELNTAIEDMQEKVAEYAKKLESQERQEMGLTQDAGTKEAKEEEVS